ncbi:MAG: O-antigen ligase family protein [Thiohalocapsa sp.]|uniref:O-antigen ligase family protein n=1 Tax=Thiohalocapsa sp. TaxID=2497641 RepID=UPI0025EC5F93|nr:O-antigen ligase family protein [Thiohalocapsa sp.]MCG6942379.1 O-antigen ligase family protein [Thiohalocapsa sp.]
MTLPPEIFPEPISFKQIVFVVMTIGYFAVAIPAAIKFPWVEKVCIFGILFMAINPVDVTFFSYTHYRGDIRGIEFGVVDWMIITMIITMQFAPRWKRRKLHYRSPNEVLLWAYFAWCTASIAWAMVPQFSFFGVTRLIRAYALFWVAYNYIRDEEDLRFVVNCVVGLTIYSFVQVLLDKYQRGVFPPRGSFDHQNSLVTFQNVMNFIVFAMLMGDNDKLFDRRNLIYWVALGAGSLTSVATLSRGGMVTMVMGYALMTPILLWLKQPGKKRGKKLAALGLMLLATLPILVVILPPIIDRFEHAPKESAEARDVFNEVAREMGNTHVLGIGLNNYSFGSGFMEQYRDQLPPIDQGGLAHNIYWLHFAELGFVGRSLWVLLMLGFIVVLLRFILKRRDSLERIFAVGLLAGFVIAMLIGKLEWNFRQTQLTFTYLMMAGFASSLARVEAERLQAARQRKQQMLALAAYARQQAMGGGAQAAPAMPQRPGRHGGRGRRSARGRGRAAGR